MKKEIIAGPIRVVITTEEIKALNKERVLANCVRIIKAKGLKRINNYEIKNNLERSYPQLSWDNYYAHSVIHDGKSGEVVINDKHFFAQVIEEAHNLCDLSYGEKTRWGTRIIKRHKGLNGTVVEL